jgi:hypothetical protein
MTSALFILALLQMSASEDACTLLQSQSKIESKLTTHTWLGKPSDLVPMLQFVEKMATVSPPERNMSGLSFIWDIVNGTLLPGLVEAHDFGQEQIDASKDKVVECITTAETAMGDVYTKGNTSSTAQTTHSTCRTDEEVERDNMTTLCTDLSDFVTTENFPTIESPAEVEALRPILKRYKNLAITFAAKDGACNSSTTVHDTKVGECNGDQSQFEGDFCLYRDALLAVDSDYTTCNTRDNSSHQSLVQELEGKVINWKAEYKAIKKILCYLNVWLYDDNTSTVNTAETCKTDEIDTTAMDIAYPTLPDEKVINVAPVAEYPGSDNWADTYNGLDSPHNEDIIDCVDL